MLLVEFNYKLCSFLAHNASNQKKRRKKEKVHIRQVIDVVSLQFRVQFRVQFIFIIYYFIKLFCFTRRKYYINISLLCIIKIFIHKRYNIVVHISEY